MKVLKARFHFLLRAIALLLFAISLSGCMASSNNALNDTPNNFSAKSAPYFQLTDPEVIFLLNHKSVLSAHLREKGDNADYFSVMLELTPLAATQFTALTQNNIGSELTLYWNGKRVSSSIIRSAIGSTFSLVLPKDYRLKQAEQFMDALAQ